MTTAIVLGSTGLIGSHLVRELQASPHFTSVVLLNRRPSGYTGAKLTERIIDFESPALEGTSGEHFFCAIGTTRRQAGSEAAQLKVDCEYPTTIATWLRAHGTRRVLLVSSVGADAASKNFYLRTKGQLEANIVALNFESTAIFRPSVLIGQRAEVRVGERVAVLLLKLLSPVMRGGLRKYRGVEARAVAARMVQEAGSEMRGTKIIEFG